MNFTRLFIEGQEVELDESVQFAITKQFEDITNPTTIINDWSKTVSIPFTESNNALFGHIYDPNKVLVAQITNEIDNCDVGYSYASAANWDENEHTFIVSGDAAYFSLTGLTVKTQLVGDTTTVVDVLVNNTSAIKRYSFDFTADSSTFNRILFQVESSPYQPAIYFDLSKLTDGNKYSVQFDLTQCDTTHLGIANLCIVQVGSKYEDTVFSRGIYFDPYKKLDFRLEWNGDVVMTGYAKMNSINQNKGKGTYDITLNGQLGKIFQEMKKITFYPEEADDEMYVIDGSEYVNTNITKELVKKCWESTGQTQESVIGAEITDIIGFAPNNSFNDDFDYATFQVGEDSSKKFTDILGDSFKEDTGIDADSVIPDGLLPREIGEYRSYLQIPYIYFNKLFQIFQKKSEDITGYKFELDPNWFSTSNPYWYKLVYMLKNFDLGTGDYDINNDKRPDNWTSNLGEGETDVTDTRSVSYEFDVHDWENCTTGLKYKFAIAFDLPDHEEMGPERFTWNGYAGLKVIFTFKDDNGNVIDTKTLVIYRENTTCQDILAEAAAADYTKLMNDDTHPQQPAASLSGYMGWRWSLDDLPLGDILTSGNYTGTITVGVSANWIRTENPILPAGDWLTNIYFIPISWNVTSGTYKRSYARFDLSDLWDKNYNLFTEILNYCKMYRIGITCDDYNKKIKFVPLSTYFQDYTIDSWESKIDKSKDFSITPITWEDKYTLFNYEDSETKLGQEYKSKYGINHGEYKIITDYNFNTETDELFEGIPTSIANTDNVLSWTNLYDYHSIVYSFPNEISVYCKDDDNKFVSCFGQYFFFNGLKSFSTEDRLRMRDVVLSDDTELQQEDHDYFYSQSINVSTVTTYPYLDIYYKTVKTTPIPIETQYKFCLFNIPQETYTYSSIETNSVRHLVARQSIYSLYWKKYINERYNVQNKKVTCYVRLKPQDYINFDFNHFVTIGNQLYFVNKIYDYDITSNESTKVDLITIQDISGYTNN